MELLDGVTRWLEFSLALLSMKTGLVSMMLSDLSVLLPTDFLSQVKACKWGALCTDNAEALTELLSCRRYQDLAQEALPR
ncbi:hypothetical protein BRADI_2g10865v3 [Brachypodium distachyon]|uniref:Uncharacterized protein n=1 Tax=Brachypodium distachyon TaxID=15368 RepID=A0A0Q3MHP7_BRADI|nr:hypothetical protein BRADI_2g10865v3 [Brachypodium distachyon]